MAGSNGTIFAYGQTASGKTHTMFGPDDRLTLLTDESTKNWGMIPRMVGTLYNKIDSDQRSTYEVFVSVCEIQREIISDLLVE